MEVVAIAVLWLADKLAGGPLGALGRDGLERLRDQVRAAKASEAASDERLNEMQRRIDTLQTLIGDLLEEAERLAEENSALTEENRALRLEVLRLRADRASQA